MPDPIKKSSWNIQQAKVKAEKDAKLKLLLQDKEFLNNLKEQSKKNNKNKEVNIKPSDATKVVIKNRPELTSKVARNKTDKEIAEERKAIREKSDANVLNQYSTELFNSDNWNRQNIAESAQGLESKFRVSDKPNFFDDYLNPANMIGGMAANLGQSPLRAQQSDSYMPYVTSIGTPLAVGAVAGLGANSAGQFVNNLANPLAGTGDLVNSLGNKYLPNAYKLNPLAKKAESFNNPNSFYRQVDDETFKEGLESGLIKGKQSVNRTQGENIINLNKFFGDDAYYFKGKLYSPQRADYIYEVNKGEEFFRPRVNNKDYLKKGVPYTVENTNVRVSRTPIPIEEATVYKKDWLKGYKPIEIPKSNFKSEINWGQWNKEIPENTQLMKEYNAIEQTSKANNTWMKNPDGSAFQGTPEQFVQQNSENFKKAFPKGFEETYRGTTGESPNLKPNRAMFTGEQKVARAYSGRDNVDNILKSEEIVNEGGVHHFVYPKSENSLVHNTAGSHWTDVNLNSSETNIKNIDLTIQRLTEDIDRKQKMMREAFQNSDGSWSFPNSDLKLSNQLYKEGTSESERMLTKLKSQKNLIQNGEYTSNPTLLNKMKSDFGTDKVVTDDIAEYIEKNNIDNVTLRNIEDGIYGDISIINHKPGNYLKSFWGNNGMFDMTNPNIYKSIVPIAGASYLATQGQEESKKLQQGGYINQNTNMNRYAQGGDLTQFNEGGLHHQNPLGGIPLGTSNDGKTNMVEQGETKNGNYIYSNRLSVSSDLAKQMFLPNYIKNKSFADASKSINDKFKDRNDTHSNATKKELLDRLTQAQENVKAQQAQINQAMQANSQQIPDQMNGEIPQGMEQFAEGGYYDSNSPFFSQDVMNPGTNPIGPYNQTPISLPSPAGLSKLSNPGLSAPTDMGLSAGLTPVKGAGLRSIAGNAVGGLGIVNSLASGDTQGALMDGAQMAAAKGLLGAGAQSAVGSFAPGIGAVQGAIGLNELAKGNGASRNKIGSAATGAMTGAMAGAGFGPAGMIALGAVGAIAGGIGSGNRREQDAELGSLNAKNANNVFRDKRYAALGGPLELSGPIEGTFTNDELTKSLAYMYKNPGSKIPLNAQFRNDDNLFPNNSTENIQSTIGTYPDGIIGLNTKKGLTDWSFRNSETFRNLPANKQNWNELPNGPRNTLDLTEKEFTKMGLTPGGRQFLEPVSNLTPTGVTYNKLQNNVSVNDINKIPLTNSEIPEKEPSFLSKLGNSINNNTVGNALRLAPVAMNAYQLAKLKKPGIQSLSRLSNTYKPQYLDEATLQNAVGNENRNTINALTNSSGGSEAALRAGILGAGLNATRGRSDAYMKMRDYNNQQNIAGQQFQLGVDQANMSQSNLEMDINDRNQASYRNVKREYLTGIAENLGSIGKEEAYKKIAKEAFGYKFNGEYYVKPDGTKLTISQVNEQIEKDKNSTQNKFGGYLKKRY